MSTSQIPLQDDLSMIEGNAERAGEKRQRERLGPVRGDVDYEEDFVDELKSLSIDKDQKGIRQSLQQSLRDFEEFLDLLRDSPLAREYRPENGVVPFHSVRQTVGLAMNSRLTDMMYVLRLRDQFMISLRRDVALDRFLMHYRLIRPLNLDDLVVGEKKPTSFEIADRITTAVQSAIGIGREEKTVQENQIRANHLRERLRQEKSQTEYLVEPDTEAQAPLRIIRPAENVWDTEKYLEKLITTQVFIDGKLYTASVDTKRRSCIDARLVPNLKAEAGSADTSAHPATFEDLLFERPFDDEPCAKVPLKLPLVYGGTIAITPMLSYNNDLDGKIILGHDVLVDEQASLPDFSESEEFDPEDPMIEAYIHLVDGRSEIRVEMRLP